MNAIASLFCPKCGPMVFCPFWPPEPCPVCKKPIADRETPHAVICAACVSDALRKIKERSTRPTGTGTGEGR